MADTPWLHTPRTLGALSVVLHAALVGLVLQMLSQMGAGPSPLQYVESPGMIVWVARLALVGWGAWLVRVRLQRMPWVVGTVWWLHRVIEICGVIVLEVMLTDAPPTATMLYGAALLGVGQAGALTLVWRHRYRKLSLTQRVWGGLLAAMGMAYGLQLMLSADQYLHGHQVMLWLIAFVEVDLVWGASRAVKPLMRRVVAVWQRRRAVEVSR